MLTNVLFFSRNQSFAFQIFWISLRERLLVHYFLVRPIDTSHLQNYLMNKPTGIDLWKFNNGNAGIMCEIGSELTLKTPERRVANKFHTFFWCFHCWLWASKYRLRNRNFADLEWILIKTSKSTICFSRSNRVLGNFAKLTRKDLCRSLFFIKIAGPRLASLLKRDTSSSV